MSLRHIVSGRTDYFELSGVLPPVPLLDFDIDQARPRPYRPFRWQYHQTMSLKKLERNHWLELDSSYRERIAERKEIFNRHGRNAVNLLPGGEDACSELVETVIQFLCIRYPCQFSFNNRTRVFHNAILGADYDLKKISPLTFLLENVPDDFMIMMEDAKTGFYVLKGGSTCTGMGWNMAGKIGKNLQEIHLPAPDYKEKMLMSMDRFFSKLTSDQPIQRASWQLEIGKPLYLQPDDPLFPPRFKQLEDLSLDDIYLRVDRQSLLRLPRSRAIIFGVNVIFTPITVLRNEPYIPRLLATVLRDGKRNLLDYKGTYHVEHKVVPALESWAKEQEEKDWVPSDWKVRTLDEEPFFPRWNMQSRKERWSVDRP
ncbi:hypothetical protein B0H34DRAFT_784890 [Crassisporium funariophilum]|nr:hypothetical protein B0H34DRAFT_784890 [Crassisporium funariophilum]